MTNLLIFQVIFLVLLLPCWQRLAGEGGSWYLGRMPQVLSALACTLPMAAIGLPWYLWAVEAVLLYLCLETGHGVALSMGGSEHDTKDDKRTQRILPVVLLLNKLTKYPWQSPAWCRLFFGVKGFLVGCCLFPMGLVLSFLWPMCYTVSKRSGMLWLKGTALSEYLTGFALISAVLLNLLFWVMLRMLGVI